MIDLNAANTEPETFTELAIFNNGYNKGLAIMANIFAEVIYKENATLESVKDVLEIIRLSTIPMRERTND